MKKEIRNEIHDEERAFFGFNDTSFYEISIKGPLDGESSFKECQNIEVYDSLFELRYPFWHDNGLLINNSSFLETSRAALWYSDHVTLNSVKMNAVKAIRECHNIVIDSSDITSEEFGWKSSNILVNDSHIAGFYAFFESHDVKLNNVTFEGKYSFQYMTNLEINNSVLKTKDAFWHTKNAIIRNSTIIGEYLAWHAENITFINCLIQGTQPICYAKNITFIDCVFERCDLSFEYSIINGNIIGNIDSIKNPLGGHLVMSNQPTLIIDDNDRSEGQFVLEIKK